MNAFGDRVEAEKIAHIDCVGGVAGDMLLAALLDAGGSEGALRQIPERLGLGGVEIKVTRVERHSIGALHVAVKEHHHGGEPHDHGHGHGSRTWRSIREQLIAARLSEPVRSKALAVLGRIADVEAAIHGTNAEEVHFHEIGAVDTLVDVVGAITLLAELGVDRIVCSALPLGHGSIKSAHGVIPLPAPATTALLSGVPVYGIDLRAETVTPTGAALAVTLADDWGPIPAMIPRRVGYGAGTADFPSRANLVRVMLGEPLPASVSTADAAAVLLETNLDDLSPELVPDAAEQCFAAGALDVWSAPVTMKKGRPGVVFSALVRPEQQDAVAQAMLRHTSALGVRALPHRRYELDRELRTVLVDGHEVRVKLGRLGGELVNVAPEHDDCAEVARITNVPVKSVWAAALSAAREIV